MRLIPATLVFTMLSALPSAANARCEKDQCWGSIAFSRLTGYWAFSMNHPTEKAARSRAWRLCNKRCTNVATVQNGCLSLFLAPRGRYATGKGRTAEAATDSARRQCATRNKNCAQRIVKCTADFEALKRQARERAKGKARPKKSPEKKLPPTRVEELKL